MSISIFQTTRICGSDSEHVGLFEVFFHHLQSTRLDNIFDTYQVIVPNLTIAAWLKNKIATKIGICCNFEFILLKKFIHQTAATDQVNSRPEVGVHNSQNYISPNQTTALIYDYLCNKVDLNDHDFLPILEYLSSGLLSGEIGNMSGEMSSKNGSRDKNTIDIYRAFQLAHQLQMIFSEYMYLRTDELLTAKFIAKIPKWQQHIWQYLMQSIADNNYTTYLDTYKYFHEQYLPNSLKLSTQLKPIFIFGVSNICVSELSILKQIAIHRPINWYYLATSNKYYGDLLSSNARVRLERKVLKEPDLQVDDLYLLDGNPLCANLAQQSREFNELLLAHEVFPAIFDSSDDIILGDKSEQNIVMTLLEYIQYDIKHLLNRTPEIYRLNCVNSSEYYANPFSDMNQIKQLRRDKSLSIQVCHNKMREVQVLFNQICEILNNNNKDNIANINDGTDCKDYITVADILITAPDINVYKSYIEAVFDNEVAIDTANAMAKIPYTISGCKIDGGTGIIRTLQVLFSLPYGMPVNYILLILNEPYILQNLKLSMLDINLVTQWFKDNNTHFGYDAKDYEVYGYKDFDAHGLKRFITNLTLGLCIPNCNNSSGTLPMYDATDDTYVPYDNLENNQLELYNKLITLLDVLINIRSVVYTNINNQYAPFKLEDIIAIIQEINSVIITLPEHALQIDVFIGKMRSYNLHNEINLPIFNSLVDEYCEGGNTSVLFTGKVTCASMALIRNVPFKVIYVLGMNFGEFPRTHQPNQLSLLSKEWAIADRNLNFEDKQIFLDIILSARNKLFISYVGRSETNNSSLRPATVLSQLISTIYNMVSNPDGSLDRGIAEQFLNDITCCNSLHPFTNNQYTTAHCRSVQSSTAPNPTPNYSVFWGGINVYSNDLKPQVHEFAPDVHLALLNSVILTPEEYSKYTTIDIQKLINTFLYTNINLFNVLGISTYNNEVLLNDVEGFDLCNYTTKKSLYSEFHKITKHTNLDYLNTLVDSGQFAQFLKAKGVLGYAHIGDYQLNLLFNLYQEQQKLLGSSPAKLSFFSKKYNILIEDIVYLDSNNDLIIVEDFANIKSHTDMAMHTYKISLKLRVKCLIYACLAKFATFTSLVDNSHNIIVNDVRLRIISQELNSIDYQVNLKDIKGLDYLWGDILKFYCYSLTNPVPIHAYAIESYIKDTNATIEKKESETRKTYEAAFKNIGLESLKQDPIFATHAERYFEVTPPENNLLFMVGDLFTSVIFNKIPESLGIRGSNR
jgi:exodeoxyribonuclease V gamma subunit